MEDEKRGGRRCLYTPAQSPRGAYKEIEWQVWCAYTVGFMFFKWAREVSLSHVNLDLEFRMLIIQASVYIFGRGERGSQPW